MRKFLMIKVDYYKYASNGNNFILIDEIAGVKIPEINKANFSKYVSNNPSGIGCDSVIFLQRYNEKTLRKLYDKKINFSGRDNKRSEYIMRVFEKGYESNMCGNGLICLGHHLLCQYGIKSARVATEIPTFSPVIRHVSSVHGNVINAVLGEASIPPAIFIDQSAISLVDGMQYYCIKDIPLSIFLAGERFNFVINNAYVTFTGEPHLVIFKQKSSLRMNDHNGYAAIIGRIFEPTVDDSTLTNSVIDQIGVQLNRRIDYFPKGININFANVISGNTIVNRCFERGINAETYACGTGAVAVAFLAKELTLLSSNDIYILPWRARQDDLYQNAVLEISSINGSYCITTKSILLSRGEYYYAARLNDMGNIFNFAA